MNKQQILVIGGGESYENLLSEEFRKSRLKFISEGIDYNPYSERKKNWKKNIQEDLGEKYEVINMFTPNSDSAIYSEWKVAFEKTLEYLDDNIYVIGHSLGAIFILKYILEKNNRNKNIEKIFMLGTPLTDSSEEVLGSFSLEKNEELYSKKSLSKSQEKLFFYASKDDSIVDFKDFIEYKKIFAHSYFREYENLGHFIEVERIKELIADIKK